MSYPSRREALRHVVLQAASVWALMAQTHQHETDPPLPAGSWQFFTPEEVAEVEAIAAQIIPSGETPGAREAGVVRFIDLNLARFETENQSVYRTGLQQVHAQVKKQFSSAARFSELNSENQIALLRSVEQTPFFNLVRTHTVMGFLSHPKYGGNQGKAGWKLIGFEDAFAFQPPYGYYDAEQGRG
jgi:gluconate 2-dehydrogenase gamma chain